MDETDSVNSAYERFKYEIGYDYSLIFKNKLISNYSQFLYFKSKDKECYPSDLIQKLWNSHIIDTKGYINYCYRNFGKIVHYDPNEILDEKQKLTKINITLNHFKNSNLNIDSEIWNNELIKENKINNDSDSYQIGHSEHTSNNIKIYISTIDKGNYYVITNKKNTIYELLELLKNNNLIEKTNIELFRVMSNKKDCDKNLTLETNNIDNNSKLYIIKSLRGC